MIWFVKKIVTINLIVWSHTNDFNNYQVGTWTHNFYLMKSHLFIRKNDHFYKQLSKKLNFELLNKYL